MVDIITVLSVFAGFVFVLVVGAKLGAGSTDSVIGLFRFEDMPPRPHGVQESDLPRFVFRDSKDLATGAA
jgi:hypothetical protein